MNNIKLSVVLSFFNEESVLPELLKRLQLSLDRCISQGKISTYELIFVNDCSTDQSEKFLRSQIPNGRVVLVNMSRNFGVSECVLAGFEISDGDVVIYMDADLQDPPELIPELLDKWLSADDIEIVYTTRLARKGEHWLKLLFTKVGYRILNKISEIELHIDSGDFKLLSRKIVNHILTFKEDRPYIRGLVSWVGFRQEQVFYERDARFDGRENTKTKVLSTKALYYWLDRALISFSDLPLKIIIFIGFGISFISLSYIVIVLLQKFLGYSVPGWAALMSAVLFLGGLQLILLGFMGLYVWAIFRDSKGRPRYIIKEIIGKGAE